MRTRSASSHTSRSTPRTGKQDAHEETNQKREEPEGKRKGGIVKVKKTATRRVKKESIQGTIKKCFSVRKTQNSVKVVRTKQGNGTQIAKEEVLVQEEHASMVLSKDEPGVQALEYRSHLVGIDDRFQHLIAAHPDPPLVSTSDIGTRPQLTFHYLVRAITYQQLAGKAAATIYGRFCALFTGGASTETPSLVVLANTVSPAQVLAVSMERLRSVGLSERKASYILGVAAEFHEGELSKTDISSLTDEELGKALVKLRGVGQWTVDMLLIFHLRRTDILPVGDLGVRKGFQLFFKLKDLPSPQAMIDLAGKWRPYRSYASWYMWRLCEMGSLPTA
eukprot:comp7242_c0_seq1/m.2958 comp7242_c0_seq1/g.2958  ORF comp7242_c0_seq1/g.2958 comp7242_c0_seq1/m.2958 type:complete len:335 (-) comp7242_c0_seq1:21-1025(-)